MDANEHNRIKKTIADPALMDKLKGLIAASKGKKMDKSGAAAEQQRLIVEHPEWDHIKDQMTMMRENIQFLRQLLLKGGLGGAGAAGPPGADFDPNKTKAIVDKTVGDMVKQQKLSADKSKDDEEKKKQHDEAIKARIERRKLEIEHDEQIKMEADAKVKAMESKLSQTEDALRLVKAQAAIDKRQNKKLRGDVSKLSELANSESERSREKDARLSDLVDSPAEKGRRR